MNPIAIVQVLYQLYKFATSPGGQALIKAVVKAGEDLKITADELVAIVAAIRTIGPVKFAEPTVDKS